MKKKIVLVCAVVAFGAMNLAFLKSDINSASTLDLNSLKISAAQADEEYPDKICTGKPGNCSGWQTYVHNQ